LKLLESAFGEAHPDFPQRLADYARILEKLHQRDAAKKSRERARAIAYRNRLSTPGVLSVDVRELEPARSPSHPAAGERDRTAAVVPAVNP
jgi:hypothetical protein